jgi:hypothetical protein
VGSSHSSGGDEGGVDRDEESAGGSSARGCRVCGRESEAAELRREAAEFRRKAEELARQVEALKGGRGAAKVEPEADPRVPCRANPLRASV